VPGEAAAEANEQAQHEQLVHAKDLLTAQDVAAMLGVTAGWVYAQSRMGRIPTIPLGRHRRYAATRSSTGSTKSNSPTPSSRQTRGWAVTPGRQRHRTPPIHVTARRLHGPARDGSGPPRDTLGTQTGGRAEARTAISAQSLVHALDYPKQVTGRCSWRRKSVRAAYFGTHSVPGSMPRFVGNRN
jgi:hypothetical protein